MMCFVLASYLCLVPLQESSPELRPGSPFLSDLSPGESIRLKMSLKKGFWSIQVEQLGMDVVLHVGLQGEPPFTTVDSPLDEHGEEWILIEAKQPGAYDLLLTTRESVGPPGRVAVHLRFVAEAGKTAAQRIQAEEADTAAGEFYGKGQRQGWQQAADHYLEAAELWSKLGEGHRQARSGYCAAVLYRLLNKPEPALEYASQALDLFRKNEDRLHEAFTLNEMGIVHLRQRNWGEARRHLESALGIWEVLNYPLGEGITRSNLCLVMRGEGRERDCLPCFQKARESMQKARSPQLEASILISLGRLHDLFAQPDAAIASYESAMTIFRNANNLRDLARTHNNLGAFYKRLGQYQRSLHHYREAWALSENSGDRRWQGRILNNLGNLYLNLGAPDQALGFFERALSLRREVGDRRGEFSTCLNLAAALDELEKGEKAEELLRQALELAKGSRSLRNQAKVLTRIGLHEQRKNRLEPALAHLQSAADLLEKEPFPHDLAQTQVKQARVLILAERAEEALRVLNAADAFYAKAGDRIGAIQVQYLAGLAQRQLDHPKMALSHGKKALELIEGVRTTLEFRQLREAFLGTQRGAYELLMDLYMAGAESGTLQNGVGLALEVSESSKARGFLELMQEAQSGITRGISPDLKQQWETAQMQVSAKANRVQKLRMNPSQKKEEKFAAEELDTALLRLRQWEVEIRKQNPRYASLTQPRGAGLAEIQALADAQSDLLLYSLGERASYLWWVRQDGIDGYALPPRSTIEALTRKLWRNLQIADPRQNGHLVDLAALSRMVLGPVWGKLRAKRLVIVPDGALNYIPFDVLQMKGDDASPPAALCETFELVHLPSASVMTLKSAGKPAPNQRLAIFADPVFSREDKRFSLPKSSGSPKSSETRSGNLNRLHGTRREAEAIMAITGRDSTTAALGFAANRQAVVTGDLKQYRGLHFATHGLLDTTRPELSSLALSQFDAQGQSRDGFLRLHDIYNLQLNAELVVLSGCETALGRDIRGEGIVGLTRGFMYAGSKGVIASLWPVPDRATAVLMGKLYHHMYVEGMSPAAALRAARLAVRSDPRWRHPYYWAAFIYKGAWTKVPP